MLERALPYAHEALQTAQAMNDRFYPSFVQGNREEALVHLGRLAEARVDLGLSMRLCRAGVFDAQASRGAVSRGALLLRKGDPALVWAQLPQGRQASAAAGEGIDRLTGLGNQRELELRRALLVKRLLAEGPPLSLAMVDLAHVKQVNDRFDHAVSTLLQHIEQEIAPLDAVIFNIGANVPSPITEASKRI